jgi:hypothetical protein
MTTTPRPANPREELKSIIDGMTADLARYTSSPGYNHQFADKKALLITRITQVYDQLEWYVPDTIWTIAQQEISGMCKSFGELSEVTITLRPSNAARPVEVKTFTRRNPTKSVRISHLL